MLCTQKYTPPHCFFCNFVVWVRIIIERTFIFKSAPGTIRPLTQAWEKRSVEEQAKREQIEREIKRKKEEYLHLLEEKARLEEHQR